MSTCISAEGEYGAHSFSPEQRFVCSRCFVFDEVPALAALAEAEVAIERVRLLADEWDGRYGPYPNGFCYSLTIHEVTGSLRRALPKPAISSGRPQGGDSS